MEIIFGMNCIIIPENVYALMIGENYPSGGKYGKEIKLK